jgi:hypothetical protein
MVIESLAGEPGDAPQLQPSTWASLLSAVDADSDGHLRWRELVAFLSAVFAHIAREREVAQVRAGHGEGGIGDGAANAMEDGSGDGGASAGLPEGGAEQVKVAHETSLSVVAVASGVPAAL